MTEAWGLVAVSVAGLVLWLAAAVHVRDERAPYVWLLAFSALVLTIASLSTYAQTLPQEWARFAATVQRVVFVIAGLYALHRVRA